MFALRCVALLCFDMCFIKVVERARPKLSNPDCVLLRIHSVGICGSDLHYYYDCEIGGQKFEFPSVLSTNFAGVFNQLLQLINGSFGSNI